MISGVIKWIDIPPVWLIGFMVLASATTGFEPLWPELIWFGRILILLGIFLILWAAVAFRRARTTIIPKQRPSALVDSGPFKYSRNPIYLADLLILAGWSISHGLTVASGATFALLFVLEWRFIRKEEDVLEADLGQPYLDYKARVRRWI
ncbi:MAG: isoprenylcysteine carboxylmethyltransferase family protein [Pseudomonadota bacterium]